MPKNEKIYMDKEGYKQFLKELEELKKRLKNNGRQKSEAYTSAVGDGWHDNFDFEDAKREEFKLLGSLNEKLEILSRIQIVEKNSDSEYIDINDYVVVDMCLNSNNSVEKIFKLVGLSSPNIDGEILEVSVNSPMGQAVYKKKVGESASYSVNKNRISLFIKNKSKELNDLIIDDKSLKRKK